MIVVLRSEKLHGLRNQVAVELDLVLAGGELLRFVGHDGKTHTRRKGFDSNVGPCEDRTVHESIEADLLEVNGRTRLCCNFERTRSLPIGWQFYGGFDANATSIGARWIQHHSIPLQVGDIRGCYNAALVGVRRRKKLELCRNVGYARRDTQ